MKYKILSTVKTAPDVWEVQYASWEGCYCSRKESKVELTQITKPVKADLLKAIS